VRSCSAAQNRLDPIGPVRPLGVNENTSKNESWFEYSYELVILFFIWWPCLLRWRTNIIEKEHNYVCGKDDYKNIIKLE
jgi:hypothetical protein